MLYKGFGTAIAVLSVSVAAQTSTDCNPLTSTCPAEPALGSHEISCDFTHGECDDFSLLPGTTISYDDKGALFTIESDEQAPTIAANKFIFFGRVEVEMIAARGQGIITSIVLQSGDLDEIDWEWVGGKDNEVQSNYFGKGDLSSYDRGAFHSVSDPFATSHTYTIEWTSKKIDWSIDGQVVRTLKYEDAKGGSRFPQTPMEIKLGTWVAGLPDAEPGTIDWGGGYTDFSQAPFNAWYRSVSVVDYAGGDSATEESIKEYVYSDNSGSWESIDVIRGDGSTGGDDDDDADLTTSIHHSSTNQASTTISATSIASTSTGVSSLVSQPSVTSTSHTAPISTDSGNSSTTSGEPTEPTGPPSSGALVNVASLLNIAFAGLGLLVIRGL